MIKGGSCVFNTSVHQKFNTITLVCSCMLLCTISYTNIDTLTFRRLASGSLLVVLVDVLGVPDARNTCRRPWVNGGAGKQGLLPVSDRQAGGLIEVCMRWWQARWDLRGSCWTPAPPDSCVALDLCRHVHSHNKTLLACLREDRSPHWTIYVWDKLLTLWKSCNNKSEGFYFVSSDFIKFCKTSRSFFLNAV